MTGLINLVSQYSSRLAILPIFSFIMGAVSVVLYFISNKRIVKYIPSFGVGIISIITAIISLATFTSKTGLNMAWIAIFLGSSALVGIICAYAIELIMQIKEKMEGMDGLDVSKVKSKQRAAKKRQASKKTRNKGA